MAYYKACTNKLKRRTINNVVMPWRSSVKLLWHVWRRGNSAFLSENAFMSVLSRHSLPDNRSAIKRRVQFRDTFYVLTRSRLPAWRAERQRRLLALDMSLCPWAVCRRHERASIVMSFVLASGENKMRVACCGGASLGRREIMSYDVSPICVYKLL